MTRWKSGKEKYAGWFHSFIGSNIYCDFFLLQDLVEPNYTKIKFWHPFESFDNSPLPKNIDDYYLFRDKVVKFVTSRNERIKRFSMNI